VESRRNQIIALVAIPLMYTLQVALVSERWRRLHGQTVRAWVQAMGEFEALQSLAGYAYEHPADPFPRFVQGAASYIGMALGHPLISADRCVRNDAQIDGAISALLISGSNMSGKSTFMRTVGINNRAGNVRRTGACAITSADTPAVRRQHPGQ